MKHAVDYTFSHHPLRPVRSDVLGEVVFFERWLSLMAAEPDHLDEIDPPNKMLKHVLAPIRSELADRDSRVCASFIRWLGTNNGQAFLREANDHSIRQRSREQGFILAWALENRRGQIGWGWRTVEGVLASQAELHADQPPALSFRDAEVIEVLVAWLGTEEGEHFLIATRDALQTAIEEERSARNESPALIM